MHGVWDQEDPIKEVRDLVKDQDLFIFNFEGVLLSKESSSETCRKFPRQSLFYSSPQIADFLHPTQFTIATLANNHILEIVEKLQPQSHLQARRGRPKDGEIEDSLERSGFAGR